MDLWNISQLNADRQKTQRLYLEFLRVPALSAGLYVLPAGGIDPQKPHREDEIYYVISGKGQMTVGTENRTVEAGTVIFVPAGVEHRFHTITEELRILVVFGPAETG